MLLYGICGPVDISCDLLAMKREITDRQKFNSCETLIWVNSITHLVHVHIYALIKILQLACDMEVHRVVIEKQRI